MADIRFDDGFEEFTINGDPQRVIRINPKDVNILARFEKSMKELKEESSSISDIEVRADGSLAEMQHSKLSENARRLQEFNESINQKMNYIFNADVTSAAFGRQSPLSLSGRDNRFLFEVFLESALEAVKERLEEAAKSMEDRAAKYSGAYKKAEMNGKKYPFPVE